MEKIERFRYEKKYIRSEILLRDKFESYLNQKENTLYEWLNLKKRKNFMRMNNKFNITIVLQKH